MSEQKEFVFYSVTVSFTDNIVRVNASDAETGEPLGAMKLRDSQVDEFRTTIGNPTVTFLSMDVGFADDGTLKVLATEPTGATVDVTDDSDVETLRRKVSNLTSTAGIMLQARQLRTS